MLSDGLLNLGFREVAFKSCVGHTFSQLSVDQFG